jgi:hypothetical protein
MKAFSWFVLSLALVAASVQNASADEAQVKAVLDKAIKAMGGEATLTKAATYSRKAKGTVNFGGAESEFTGESITQGLDRYRFTFEGEFGGNKISSVAVLNGEKVWRTFAGNKMELDKEAAANERRNTYMQIIPATILPLKGKTFKVESADDEKVGDKPAAVLKVTGPEGKDFTLFFDKESGLPIKLRAVVLGFQGDEYTQESTYADYKDFNGIKHPTKIEISRDGQPFLKQEITEFKILEKVDPKSFDEPS